MATTSLFKVGKLLESAGYFQPDNINEKITEMLRYGPYLLPILFLKCVTENIHK